MADVILTNVMQSCPGPGIGSFATFTAISGRDTFGNRMSAGQDAHYMAMAVDANGVPTGNWEAGEGTWDGANLSRNRVYKSSNSDTFVNFTDTTLYLYGVLIPDETIVLQDDDSIRIPKLTLANPLVPAANTMSFFTRALANRIMPAFVGPSGLDSVLQPHIGRNRARMLVANSPGLATLSGWGLSNTTIVGTGTNRTWASTNALTRMARTGLVSAATAAAFAHTRSGTGTTGTAVLSTGNAAAYPLGGFHFIIRGGISDAATVAGARMFVGLASSTAAPTNVEPSTLTNCIGLAQLSTDATQLYLVYGGSAAQTPIALGATDFPINSATPVELALFAPPSVASTIYYQVTNLATGATVTGTITGGTTVVPAATTGLAWHIWRTNNATLLAVGYDLVSLYIETDQ